MTRNASHGLMAEPGRVLRQNSATVIIDPAAFKNSSTIMNTSKKRELEKGAGTETVREPFMKEDLSFTRIL